MNIRPARPPSCVHGQSRSPQNTGVGDVSMTDHLSTELSSSQCRSTESASTDTATTKARSAERRSTKVKSTDTPTTEAPSAEVRSTKIKSTQNESTEPRCIESRIATTESNGVPASKLQPDNRLRLDAPPSTLLGRREWFRSIARDVQLSVNQCRSLGAAVCGINQSFESLLTGETGAAALEVGRRSG